MNAQIEIKFYGLKGCPFSIEALCYIHCLAENNPSNVKIIEKLMTERNDHELTKVRNYCQTKKGHGTHPMIFINDKFIGGCSELKKFIYEKFGNDYFAQNCMKCRKN